MVAGIGLKVAYDNYVYGEFEVAAPSNEQLNNIADNWAILDTHTDKFLNYYTLMGVSTDGTDGAGNVALIYTGSENVEEVSIQVIDINNDTVIVEFGNNKNCRIPMDKSAISRVEKPEA